MIVPYMKPPYEITPSILKLITSISEKIGEKNKTTYRLKIIRHNTA